MHKFDNNWLLQREKIDTQSKSKILINKINSYFKIYKEINIIDLGCGAGSNFRYLYSKIKNKQTWDMIDISFESLNYFKKDISKNNKVTKVNFVKKNLIKNLHQIKFEKFNLATGSAFLDIMPKSWFKNFYKLNTKTNIIYFAINFDGNFIFYPTHKDDKLVLKLFNSDQKTDKGSGQKAVGSDCTKIINSLFKKTHKTYIYNSDWKVKNNKAFQNMFINFCENVISKNKYDLSDWLIYRRKLINNNKSKFILKNKDFLAIKM